MIGGGLLLPAPVAQAAQQDAVPSVSSLLGDQEATIAAARKRAEAAKLDLDDTSDLYGGSGDTLLTALLGIAPIALGAAISGRRGMLAGSTAALSGLNSYGAVQKQNMALELGKDTREYDAAQKDLNEAEKSRQTLTLANADDRRADQQQNLYEGQLGIQRQQMADAADERKQRQNDTLMERANRLGPAAFPEGSPEKEEATRRLKEYQENTSKAFRDQAATEKDQDVKDQLLSAAERAASAPTIQSISEISSNATKTASTTASQKVKASRDYELADNILSEAGFKRDPDSPKIPILPRNTDDQAGAIQLARAPKEVEKTRNIARKMAAIVNEIGAAPAINTLSATSPQQDAKLQRLSQLATEYSQLRSQLQAGYVGKGAFTGVLSNQDLERLDKLIPPDLKGDNALQELQRAFTTNRSTVLGSIRGVELGAIRNYGAMQKEYGLIGPKITYE